MRFLVNGITFSRIPLSLLLLFCEPLSPAFLLLYALCGLTDLLDGIIARTTGTTSGFGAKLDSVADLTMTVAALIILFPVLGLTAGMIVWILGIGIIRLTSMGTALCKFKTFASIHTYGNKITGLSVFVIPFLLLYIPSFALLSAVCFIATLSAAEELAIIFTSTNLELNRKGYFLK